MGCEPCLESLPARAKRIRGVESAEVDVAKGILRVRLAEQNRVRLEQLRDIIEQDGTKATKALITVAGELDGMTWKIPNQTVPLELDTAPPVGASVITGEITNLKPAPGEKMRLILKK